MALTSAADPKASWEPPLNPNHPIHNKKVPRVASGKLAPGSGSTRPRLSYLPRRGPSTIAPTKAAQPPTECTMVEPAKSLNSMLFSQPPPHDQAAWTG